jgi:hypothetical protein
MSSKILWKKNIKQLPYRYRHRYLQYLH